MGHTYMFLDKKTPTNNLLIILSIAYYYFYDSYYQYICKFNIVLFSVYKVYCISWYNNVVFK